ncbi:hypothetical protein [Nocardia sp. NRRL S-836]|uniref:hypothetical protein n=1 Tax=Nocardia sp. NRRL S-836 TaxID=1519492 RepID=UPI0006B053FB|nr:hypothetical protein [Nocardia sp. NRRL S-836]KOV85725.1 hypothetical protein ADL03_10645 [Nocardia sp. NRRL S-836]
MADRTPRRFWRELRWWGSELGEGVAEVLLAWAALGFVFVVGLLGSLAWRTAPLPTAVLAAGAVAFLAFGGVEFFRSRRRGRLTTLAVCAFGFVLLWVALSLWPYRLF